MKAKKRRVVPLVARRGYAGRLQKVVRSHRRREVSVKLVLQKGTDSRYTAYSHNGTRLGETIIRSDKAPKSTEKTRLRIGWNRHGNEKLEIHIVA